MVGLAADEKNERADDPKPGVSAGRSADSIGGNDIGRNGVFFGDTPDCRRLQNRQNVDARAAASALVAPPNWFQHNRFHAVIEFIGLRINTPRKVNNACAPTIGAYRGKYRDGESTVYCVGNTKLASAA